MWKDTLVPMTHVQVREYFAQCQCGQMNYLHRYAGVEDKENNPIKEAFIEKCTDDQIDEMIERVVMESESKWKSTKEIPNALKSRLTKYCLQKSGMYRYEL